MIFGIGDVERLAHERRALRMIERGLAVGTVFGTDGAAADDVQQSAVERADHNPVVVAVGDEQPIVVLIGEHLPREPQRGRFRRGAFQVEADGRPVERSLGLVISDELGNSIVQGLPKSLAGAPCAEISFGIDQHHCRPGVHTELSPEDHFRVVDNGMFNLVAKNGLPDVLGIPLVLELGRVHADDDQLTGVFPLQELEVRQDVHTVDAAVGPEVEQHDLSAQVADSDGARYVQPAGPAVQHARGQFDTLRVGVLQLRPVRGGHWGILLIGVVAAQHDGNDHDRKQRRRPNGKPPGVGSRCRIRLPAFNHVAGPLGWVRATH